LLIARGSYDRQAGGLSRFARAEQRSATTTSSAAKPSTPTATGAGSSTSSNVSATKSSSNPYPQSHNAFSAQPVLAAIARSQRPASIVQAAARAAEGEVVNLRHNSVTARLARCRSLRKGASRESAGRRPKHRRGKWRCWLSGTEAKRSSQAYWRGARRDRTRPALPAPALTRRCRSLSSTRAHKPFRPRGLPGSALRDRALRDPFVQIVCERARVACPHVGRDGVVEGLLEVGA
jgi:hypothetical protein